MATVIGYSERTSQTEGDKMTKCRIKRCDAEARYVLSTEGHPNGDISAAYCHEHATLGHWDDSPRPYRIVIEGPFANIPKGVGR